MIPFQTIGSYTLAALKSFRPSLDCCYPLMVMLMSIEDEGGFADDLTARYPNHPHDLTDDTDDVCHKLPSHSLFTLIICL